MASSSDQKSGIPAGGDNNNNINDIANGLEGTDLNKSSVEAEAATASTAAVPAVPLPEYLPKTISRSYDIYGQNTDCYCQIFSDRIVVGCTQFDQKIGNWILCSAIQSPTDPRATDYEISTLIGDSTNIVLGLYARQLTEQLISAASSSGSASNNIISTKGKSSLQVLLGISLARKDKNLSKKEQEEQNQKMFRVLVPVLVDLVLDTAAM